jgi:hypothetical protein
VTIFRQANKGKSTVFIAMIHLMRYIYFCFDVILHHPVKTYNSGQKSYQYRRVMYHLTFYASYISVLFSYLCSNVFV